MLIGVSGHSRGVGKTSLVEAVIRTLPGHNFSTLKISGHCHGGGDGLQPARVANRLVAYLRPDLLLFVCHPEIADWKASSDACLASCDAVVLRSEACAARINACSRSGRGG